MALSTCEAEYMALAVAAQEAKFLIQLLQCLVVVIQVSIHVPSTETTKVALLSLKTLYTTSALNTSILGIILLGKKYRRAQ